MTVDQWIDINSRGIHIDEDGYYGAQCWDVVARYAREVVGCPSFPTGSGGAEGLFRIFADPIPQYFDRIANNPNDATQLPRKGDVIVWQASFSPPYGHTALVISADAGGVRVLEQNGNNPGGNAYQITRNFVGVSGWLRPKKGQEMEHPVEQDAKNLYQVLYDLPANPGQIAFATSKTWKDFMYQEIGGYYRDYVTPLRQAAAQLPGVQAELDATKVQLDEAVKASALKDQRIADLQKQVPGSTEVEQPVVGKSLWDVIKDFLSQFKKG